MMGHQCILIHRMKRRSSTHQGQISERLMETMFSSGDTMTEDEKEYLSAAASGDLETVQMCIHEKNVNINCVDHMGRSAAELGLLGDHYALVQYLLPRSNIQAVEDALLYAIEKDNMRYCELILDHPLYKNNRIRLSSVTGFYQQENRGPRLRPDTTPIVLAAQKNNFQITKLLMDRGSTIATPHDYFCECIECSNMRKYDSVKYSRSRLSTFAALTSPAYISLSAEDPILTAFLLSHQMKQLSDIEKEYKREYQLLCEQCKDYAVELLDLCRSTEEIMAVLDEDGSEDKRPTGIHSLSRVKLSLKYGQKRFIAHPTCQRQMIALWYSGVPWMRHQKIFVKLLSVPLATLLLPISSLAFVVLPPNTEFSRILKSPFVKFLNHTCAYITFLILVLMATLRGGSGNTWMDMACTSLREALPHSCISILILIWVIGMFVHECRQLWREGPRDYLGDWWNWMDSSLILLYLASFALQVVVYVKVSQSGPAVKKLLCPNVTNTMSCREMSCTVDNLEKNWTQCTGYGDCSRMDDLYGHQSSGHVQDMMSDMNQLSDIFFSLASVLSFARIVHLLPANEQLGPLLVSFGRMLKDVLRFGVVFLLVFLAFMTGLTSLYRVHQCENKHFSRLDLSLGSLFWATFGMGDTKATVIDNRYLGSNLNLITSHTKHNRLVVLVGYALFWSYIAGAVVVLLNMLIAMMSNSFQEIYDHRDVEWKFARAKLWIDFFESGCTLPTPFNIIPNPKYLVKLFQCVKMKIKGDRSDPPVQMEYIYKQITDRLIQRYIYKKQNDLYEMSQAETDMLELKQDIGTLNNDLTKLRMEMANIRTSLGTSKTKNGFTKNGASTKKSRVIIDV